MHSDWQNFLDARDASMAECAVSNFGRPAAELQAAGGSNILVDLSHLGLLQVGGEDAVNFLQGQLTNDVKLLDGGNSQYAGYCTAKGRLLALFLAFAHHDHLHLQLDGTLVAPVLKRLKMYVLRSKVVIDDVSDSIIRIGVAGGNTPAAVQALFGNAPQAPHQLLNLETVNILRLPGTVPRYEIFTTPQHAPEIWAALEKSCTPAGKPCWDWLDIRAGIPQVSLATQEAFVPQMINLDLLGGISFKKGCYTGQEIVARTHYLGKVKRRTHLAHASPGEMPQPGEYLYGVDSAEPVGLVVSAAPAPEGGYDLLAEIRLESVEAGEIRLGSKEGTAMEWLALPYAL
jgi:tRNA-modifying protein YgfZ